MSQEVMKWEVEESDLSGISIAIDAALEKRKKELK